METGGLEEFQTEYATMLQELGREFPYSTVIYYTPEFGTNWDTYGNRLGNFASYGINNTVGYAQATNQDLPAEATNAYLYFDDIHNTESGQKMTAQAMALTLESNREAIAAATLTIKQLGTSRPNVLLATRENSELIGRAANDLLRGNTGNDALWGDRGQDTLSGAQGNDWLQGGQGSDRLRGGVGADFFSYQTKDASSRWRDTITDLTAGRAIGWGSSPCWTARIPSPIQAGSTSAPRPSTGQRLSCGLPMGVCRAMWMAMARPTYAFSCWG